MGRGSKHRYGVKNLYNYASQDTTIGTKWERVISTSCGTVNITGSRDIDTGLTTVVSGGANVANCAKLTVGVHAPYDAHVRISKSTGPTIPGTKGAGYMKILCTTMTASVEAATAASVDWFAFGVE